MRGKLRKATNDPPATRLIPARAGKTQSRRGVSTCAGAHPRACGENVVDGFEVEAHPGSSPRVRGKPCILEAAYQAGRLIPARAGKTVVGRGVSRKDGAHPRACGENAAMKASGKTGAGSSPRVRGKPMSGVSSQGEGGLIPARAGKTGTGPGVAAPGRAHPRACGENELSDIQNITAQGSSPRVRGKPRRDDEQGVRVGLIPARAGKTAQVDPALGQVEAHPRACGENGDIPAGMTFDEGSSPRVRGKRRDPRRRHGRGRLIPARAGKTRA